MNLTIHYFAILRERAGRSAETVLSDAATARDLWREADLSHSFHLDVSSFAVAVNDTFVPWDHPLREGDQVAFLPPVSGG